MDFIEIIAQIGVELYFQYFLIIFLYINSIVLLSFPVYYFVKFVLKHVK